MKKEAKGEKIQKLKIQEGNVKKDKNFVWYLSVSNGRWTAKFKSEKWKKSENKFAKSSK